MEGTTVAADLLEVAAAEADVGLPGRKEDAWNE
jgi:hypothetical protein